MNTMNFKTLGLLRKSEQDKSETNSVHSEKSVDGDNSQGFDYEKSDDNKEYRSESDQSGNETEKMMTTRTMMTTTK